MSSCEEYETGELGPLNIDYLHLFYCSSTGARALVTPLFLAWTVFLIYLLGNTADAYFTPTLSSICVKFRIPYQVAGVTFLAFGNGAPDIFASVTSFTEGQNELIGVGALLGASVFVSSVVVAVVALICPCKVEPYSFARDVIFHLLAVILMTVVAIKESVSMVVACLFLILYAVYVAIVVVGWYIDRSNMEGSDGLCREMEEIVEGGVHAAFWHSSTSGPSSSGSEKGATPGGYSFLLLGDTSLKGSHKGNTNFRVDDDHDSDSSSDDEYTVNLTGGLITPQFNHAIHEDHFSPKDNHHNDNSANKEISQPAIESHASHHSDKKKDTQASPEGGQRRNSSSESDHGSICSDLEAPLLSERGSTKFSGTGALIASARDMMATNLYWQQWRLKRRARKTFMTAEWWEYPWHWKIFAIVEFPFSFCRDLTIPTVDADLWSKTYSTMQPICSPLLLLYTFGWWHSSVGIMPAPLLCCFIGIPLSLTVFVLTHASRPPSGDTLSTIWTFAAFVMCVVWIYFFAGELVTCLEAIGTISGIPPAVLGLTLLAWGNSVGDLLANVAVARQGLGEMAIAGSYGGPVLNLCLGLGLPFVYSAMNNPSHKLTIDASTVISIVFVILILVSTLAIVVLFDYEMKPLLGYYLLGMFSVYTFVQLCSLYFVMH